MARYRVQTPSGRTLFIEGDEFPTEEQLLQLESSYQPKQPEVSPQTTLPEIFNQPTQQIQPWEGGVVRSVLPGVLQPEDLLPAVRKIGGELAVGEPGDTHPDIIEDEKIPAVDIDQRGFVGPGGKFFDRESAAIGTQIPTELEQGRLHSTDLSKAQDKYEDIRALAPWMVPPAPQPPPPSLEPVSAEAVSAITPEGKRLLPGAQLPPEPPSPVAAQQPPMPPGVAEMIEAMERAPKIRSAGELLQTATGFMDIPGAILDVAGLTPEQVPSGAEISRVTGLPKAVTIPMSSVAKTAEGFAQFLASKKGISQSMLAAMPVVGVGQLAYWVGDMIKGAGEMAVDLIKAVKANDWQRASDDFVGLLGTTAMLKGGKVPGTRISTPGLMKHTYRKGIETLNRLAAKIPDAGNTVSLDPIKGWSVIIGSEAKTGFKTKQEAQVELAKVQNGKIEWTPDVRADFTQNQVPTPPMVLNSQQKVREQMMRSEAKSAGKKIEILDADFGGDVAYAAPDGTIKVSRPRLHQFLEMKVNEGKAPEDTIASIVNHEVIHTATPKADAERYYELMSPLERLMEKRRYLGREGGELSGADLGWEAIRFKLQRASGMTATEFVSFGRREAMTAKALGALSETVFSIRKKISKKATSEQLEILDKISKNIEAAKKGIKDASQVQKAAEVHGTMRAQPVEGVREVPAEVRGPGVQPPPEAVAQEAQVPLTTEKAPPAAPTEGAQPAAPATGKAEPAEAPKPPAVEPAISETKPAVEPAQVKPEKPAPPTEEAELKSLNAIIRERDLTGAEANRYDELMAKRRAARKGPAMRLRQEELAEELGLRYRGTMRGVDQYVYDEPSARTGAPSGITVSVPEGTDAAGVRAKMAARMSEYGLEGPAMRMRDMLPDDLKDPENILAMPVGAVRDYLQAAGVSPTRAAYMLSDTITSTERAAEIKSAHDQVGKEVNALAKAGNIQAAVDTAMVKGQLFSEALRMSEARNAVIRGEPIEGTAKKLGVEESDLMRILHGEAIEAGAFPAMRLKADYSLLGVVDDRGAVQLEKIARPGMAHIEVGMGAGEKTRWRYDKANNEVAWMDTPSLDETFAVDSALSKNGIYPDRHTDWMDTGRDFQSPAMRIKDMSDEEFQNYLRPIKMAAGNDPAKQEEAYRSIMDQIAREEDVEFQAKQPPVPEVALGPEDAVSQTPTYLHITTILEDYLNRVVEPKPITKELKKEGPVRPEYLRPTFKDFVHKVLGYQIPGITEDSLRWVWAEKVSDHLMNASGKRLEDWRKAMKLEGRMRYGTRTIADPPREMTMDEKRDYARATKSMDAAEIRQYNRDIKKSQEAAQKYRRRLITEIQSRLYDEAIPKVGKLTRTDIGINDIAFDDARSILGAYRSFSSGESANLGFLNNWLDDRARVGKGEKIANTRRVTVLVNRKTGTVELVSTYKHGRRGIMLYDPILAPGIDKAHHPLESLLKQYRVKSSILLNSPVNKFHMRIEADPETGRSAEQVFMDLIGKEGEARESHLDKIWQDFQHEAAEAREKERAEGAEFRPFAKISPGEEAPVGTRPQDIELQTGELPPVRIERGEGGMFVGGASTSARAQAGVLRSNLKYFARGPMSRVEAEGLVELFARYEVRGVNDIKTMLSAVSDLARQIEITGKRRGLRGSEYCAISAIDKAVRKHYLEIKRDPAEQKKLAELKDPTARKSYDEGLKMDAMYRALSDLYETAEKHAFEYGPATGKVPQQRIGYGVIEAATEILDRYGDTTRRSLESAAAPEKPAPVKKTVRTAQEQLAQYYSDQTKLENWLKARKGFSDYPGQVLGKKPIPKFSDISRPAPEGVQREILDIRAARPSPRYPTRKTWLEPIDRPPQERMMTPEESEQVRTGAEAKYGPQAPMGKGFMGTGIPIGKAEPTGPAMRIKDFYGIAERIRDLRADLGTVAAIFPGEGISAKDSVQRGRELIKAGADAEQLMKRFEDDPDKRVSEDDIAVSRAYGEQIAKDAEKIKESNGRDSDAYRKAFSALSRWDARSKEMQTVWSRMGQAQQGATDLDTGSFTAMQREYRASTGKDFTPRQAEQADLRAERQKKADADVERSKATLFDQVNRPEALDPQTQATADRIIASMSKTANDALARIRKRRAEGRMFSAPTIIPPEDLVDYAIYGSAKMVEMSVRGTLTANRWRKEMMKDIGDWIRPHLDQIWEASEERAYKEVQRQAPEPANEPVRRAMTRMDPATMGIDETRKILGTKKPGVVTVEQARAIWNYVKKEYLERGEDDFDIIRHKVANDLGLSVQEVTECLAANRTMRRITDDMYKKMATQRRIKDEAKNWLKNQQYHVLKQWIRKVPRIFFIDKVFGHGTVGLITHAGNMVFDPMSWKVYFPQYIEMYRYVFSSAYHQRAMRDLQMDKYYILAKRAGLMNDPFKYTDDYHVNAIVNFFKGGIGNRGFDALKTLRQKKFNQLWEGTPDNLKWEVDDNGKYKLDKYGNRMANMKMAQLWADTVNHQTGVVKQAFPEVANWVLFAPKLEGSRWAWMLRDPYKAMEIFLDWKRATPEQKRWAQHEFKNKLAIGAMYIGALAANQGILKALGSDQDVNILDPKKPDFWAFKVAGFKVGVISPMIGMVRMMLRLIDAATSGRARIPGRDRSRREQAMVDVGKYWQGKASPFASFAGSALVQSDYAERPLPWSRDVPPKWLRRQGIGRYTYPEYLVESFAPIPAEEMIKEVWHGYGMGDSHIKVWSKAVAIALPMASTGVRVTEDITR